MDDVPSRPEAVLPRPSWLPVDTWPHDAQPLDVDGTRVAYYDVGSEPVLVLLHTGLWSFIWRDVISRLCGQFRCICIDAPGALLERRKRCVLFLPEDEHRINPCDEPYWQI